MRALAALLATFAAALALSACGSDSSPSSGGEAVTITHKYGATKVPAAPKRVVAIGYNDQDFVLSLGVTPVGARQFQGGIDVSRRPWAAKQLAGRTPPVTVGAEQIDFEKVAAQRPDLIVGIYSGMTDADYGKLSKIAPTIPQRKDWVDFGEPWQEQLKTTAQALGRAPQGGRVTDRVEGVFAKAREDNPEFAGKSLVFAVGSAKDVFVYSPQDLRVRLFTQLGFTIPPAVKKLVSKAFYSTVSRERADLIDADVLVIYGDQKKIEADPVLGRLDVVKDKRTIYLPEDGDFANAIGFSSPLSLPYALDLVVPQLKAALARL